MTDPQTSLERKSNHRRQVAIGRAARGVHTAVLVVFVASCMYPYQPGPYQQGQYQQGQHQQGQRNGYAGTSPGNSGYSEDSGYSDDTGYSGYPRNSGNSGSDSGSGEWHCRAVGTYVRGSYGSGPDYSDPQNVDITKWGRTRDEAGIAAIDACSDLLHLSANPTLSPGSLVTEECTAITCSR
jgi:hypothetical protein